MQSMIFETLQNLGLTTPETSFIFSKSTRDVKNLNVWKDKISDVIYIKDFYVGNGEYEKNKYRSWSPVDSNSHDYEDERNLLRRYNDFKPFFWGKKVCDFGCGKAKLLSEIKDITEIVVGIELTKDHLFFAKQRGIECYDSFQLDQKEFFDTITFFHVLEHLPDPIDMLKKSYGCLKQGGKLIIEVPHAKDFLLNDFAFCEEYKKFTLWSQHLVLHTRHSLKMFLQECGFKVDLIKGIQRYNLSNHITWLAQGKPGGHKSQLSLLENEKLNNEYQLSLNAIDATDTLVAIASKI